MAQRSCFRMVLLAGAAAGMAAVAQVCAAAGAAQSMSPTLDSVLFAGRQRMAQKLERPSIDNLKMNSFQSSNSTKPGSPGSFESGRRLESKSWNSGSDKIGFSKKTASDINHALWCKSFKDRMTKSGMTADQQAPYLASAHC
jgi:hypothetical protein